MLWIYHFLMTYNLLDKEENMVKIGKMKYGNELKDDKKLYPGKYDKQLCFIDTHSPMKNK